MVAETKQRAAGAVVQIEQRRSNSSNGDGAAVTFGQGEREWCQWIAVDERVTTTERERAMK